MFLRSLLPQQKIRNLLARNARNLVKGIKFLKHYQHSPKYKGSSNSYLWKWRKDRPKKNWSWKKNEWSLSKKMTNAGKLTPNCSNNGLIDNYQQDGQNKGKCLLDQNLSRPLLLFHMAYFPASSLRSFLCLSSGLQIKYCSEYHGSCSIGHHFVFNFRLQGYPAYSV